MKGLKLVINLLEILSFGALLILVVFFAMSYSVLPENLPHIQIALNSFIQFNTKDVLIGLFWAGFLFYSILFLLRKFPSLHVYPVKITVENVEKQLYLSRLFIGIIKLIGMVGIVLLFLHVYYYFNEGILQNLLRELMVTLGLMVLCVAVYIPVARHYR